MTACKVDGCTGDTSHGGRGYCGMHLQRVKRTGEPGPATSTRHIGRAPVDRVLDRCEHDPRTGCIVFRGAERNGYGAIGVDGRVEYAHRVVYEALVGPIPEGLVLDHVCMVRRCVNVEHLDAVTDAENKRRGGRLRGARAREEK